jgi:hypothetical protein
VNRQVIAFAAAAASAFFASFSAFFARPLSFFVFAAFGGISRYNNQKDYNVLDKDKDGANILSDGSLTAVRFSRNTYSTTEPVTRVVEMTLTNSFPGVVIFLLGSSETSVQTFM